MKKRLRRCLALLLAAALLFNVNVPVRAAGNDESLNFVPSDIKPNLHMADSAAAEKAETTYADDEMVRVSIVLEEKSTIDAGYSTKDIVKDDGAMDYRSGLKARQAKITDKIENQVLDGSSLDVVWNLTLAANLISANVEYGQIEGIKAIDGVKDVFVEKVYRPCVVDEDLEDDPNMATSPDMIGSPTAYSAGYTGAGRRIAIIDTGTDTDHQSFSADGYEYSLSRLAEKAGVSLEEYKASLNLLDEEEISARLGELNISAADPDLTADELYVNSKLPFGYNYVDENLDIIHDNDTQGEHGSHVAGIAAANAYIADGEGGYVSALDAVKVQGVAPDAQIITMKVFGKNGGAYDSDYMAAIEDALILGADSVNLSLGSSNPGFSRDTTYQDILSGLVESDTVVVMSAGNAGGWADSAYTGGYLYGDDVSLDTAGSPGSYTNSLSVASVDNDGYTGQYLLVDGASLFYTETAGYSNEPFTTLAGTQEYIMIDGVGTEEEFAALADVLKGRIAVCSRGEISFYEKAENAVKYGAIATIICNNQAGTISMDLSDYTQSEPCVSVTQEDAALLRGAAEAVEEDGNVLYYKGSLEVSSEIGTTSYGSDYYTMSDFSSWGVPGSLELKPEITAPGGNIYSVNGAIPGGMAYESMSGTSMAAPQVAGMMALLGQHLEAGNVNLLDKTGLRQRTLSQSLLMSTAVPLIEEDSGSYYSVMKQGAGLADIGAAVSAQSYLMMKEDATASAADGKIKAELGDDPERTGTYSYSFTLNNLNGAENSYTLSTDMFTQDLFAYNGSVWLDTWTIGLPAYVSYVVDGETFVPFAAIDADVDRDGDTDADDAQAILDYLAGNVENPEETLDLEAGDLDGDGKYTTYDAHLILAGLETAAITVPADGSVTIQVNISFSDEVKAYLDAMYENGAYVEGYTYVESVATQEGSLDVTHSVPILGFYGNWSDASMYDTLSYTSYLYGDQSIPYTGEIATNNLIYRDSTDGKDYYQIGNPYAVEESYPEGKAAIRSEDLLTKYKVSLIRNAAEMALVITDGDGNLLYAGPVSSEAYGAFYYSTGGTWEYTTSNVSINKTAASLGVKEGDTINVSVVAVPEYYLENAEEVSAEQLKELISSGVLGEGVYKTTTLKVDDTAPELLDVSKDPVTGDLTVTAQDNQNIAYVAVMSRSGAKLYAGTVPEQENAGEQVSCTLKVGDAGIGEKCMVYVADYAGNAVSYVVEYGGEEMDYSGMMFAYTSSDLLGSANAWVQIDPDQVWFNAEDGSFGGMEVFGNSSVGVAAAEYIDGYVFFIGTDDVFYVTPQNELGYNTKITDVSRFGLTGACDMAMNYADGKLYVLDSYNTVWSLNPLTGEAVQEFTVVLADKSSFLGSLTTMAIDDEGTFYAANYGSPGTSDMYRWTLADVTQGEVSLTAVSPEETGIGCWNKFSGSMTWDHENDILYMASAYTNENAGDYDNVLWVIDPETGVGAPASGADNEYASILQACFTGLYVVSGSGSDGYEPTDEILSVDITKETITALPGTSLTLEVTVAPWTANNKDLIWTSSDESVAAVERGVVTTGSEGTAVITATSAVDPAKSDSCVITVTEVPSIKLNASIYDVDSTVAWTEFNANATGEWKKVSATTAPYIAGALYNGKIYVHDGSSIYSVDPDSFETVNLGGIASTWLWSDAAPAPVLSGGAFGNLLGLCNNGTFLELLNPEAGSLSYFDFTGQFDAPMASVAFAGNTEYYGMEALSYYLMLEDGTLYALYLFSDGENSYIDYAAIGSTGLSLSGVSAVTAGQYASMEYDETSGYLALSLYTEGETANLYLIDPVTCLAANVGGFGDAVWPVVSLYQYDRPTDLTLRIGTLPTLYVGTSAVLPVEVVMYESDDSVSFESSDPSVATVDENGVVTGVGEGTATITVTTAEVNDAGEHVSASCTVTVESKSVLNGSTGFHAQITAEEGTQWVGIAVDGADITADVEGSTDVTLTGAGAHGGKIYGSDSDYVNMGSFYQINPANGYAVSEGSPCSTDFAALDMTTAPVQTVDVVGEDGTAYKGEAFGYPVLLINAHGVYMMTDYVEGYVIGNPYLAYYLPNAAAITYAGYLDIGEDDVLMAELFYVLSTDGNLSGVAIAPEPYTEDGVVGLDYSFYLYDFGNVGRTFDNGQTLSMTLADITGDGYADGLMVADSGNGRADLYYADLMSDTASCEYIGCLEGATSIAGLYTDEEIGLSVSGLGLDAAFAAELTAEKMSVTDIMPDAGISTFAVREPSMGIAAAESNVSMAAGTSSDEVSGSAFDVAAAKRGVTGTTNAVTVDNPETVDVEKDGVLIDTETNTVTVKIAAKDTTNGLLILGYDADILTLDRVLGVGYHSYSVDRNGNEGSVLFDFADAEDINMLVATLTFTYDEKDENGLTTAFLMSVLEDGDPAAEGAPDKENPVTEEIPVKIPVVYNVSLDLTGGSADAPVTVPGGQDLTITLKPANGYVLPETITVTIGGVVLEPSMYTYNTETGLVTIPGEYVTGDVKISAQFAADTQEPVTPVNPEKPSNPDKDKDPDDNKPSTNGDKPQTGDATETGDTTQTMALVLLACMAGALAVVFCKKRRDGQENEA